MTTITIDRAVVEQALEAIESDTMLFSAWTEKMIAARTALRAALAQQDEPQDAELSAALGWPGGISEPVLDRKTLLRQVADLRAALAQQAEPVDGACLHGVDDGACKECYAANAEPVEPVAWRNAALRVGEDLCSVSPFGYYDMTAQQWLDWALSVVTVHNPQPVQEPVAWVKEDVCDGQYIDGRPRKIWWECNKGVGTAFYTAPPQRKPLTEEEIWELYYALPSDDVARSDCVVRAVEAAHGIGGQP